MAELRGARRKMRLAKRVTGEYIFGKVVKVGLDERSMGWENERNGWLKRVRGKMKDPKNERDIVRLWSGWKNSCVDWIYGGWNSLMNSLRTWRFAKARKLIAPK
jgi:hypothetical protein